MSLLSVDNISIEFGGLKAVQNFSLELEMGELVSVIGPNGAGKTTTFNMLTGIYRPSQGTITMDGELLNGKSPHEFTAHGIARTFQNIRLFGSVSVLDNLTIAMELQAKYSLLDAFLRYFSRFQRPFKQLGDFLPGKGFGRGNAGPAIYNNPQADPFNRRTGQAVNRFPQDAYLAGIVCLIIQLIIGNVLFRRVSRGFFAER